MLSPTKPPHNLLNAALSIALAATLPSRGEGGHAPTRERLHVGGFSDEVFKLLADVVAGRHSADHWVREIEKQRL